MGLLGGLEVLLKSCLSITYSAVNVWAGHLQEELAAGEDIARCPSCSLYITVIYNPEDFSATEPVVPPMRTPEVAVS